MPEKDTNENPEDRRLTDLRKNILDERNRLYEKSCESWWAKLTTTIVLKQILGPLLQHGSRLIYAPDVIFREAMSKNTREKCTGAMSNFLAPLKAISWRQLFLFVLFGVSALLLKKHSSELTCWIQDTFLGWAQWNQDLPWWRRGMSISLMMVLRLVVSNVLPFTSPAFAYLVAMSQPAGENWKGVYYLLICSTFAGAVVPMLDWAAYWVTRPCYKEQDDKKNHFLATEFFSFMTDYLPFSFWVRPYFMEPTFETAWASNERETAAAMAVLTGHFMIWAGPATTMYSRKFVPDWWTSIIIQPLGMSEDVAVVLATWAGGSVSDREKAELSLYAFMLIMNFVNYVTYWNPKKRGWKRGIEHLIVAVMTAVLAGYIRLYLQIWVPFTQEEFTTTTITTTAAPHCKSIHSNVKAMLTTIAWVTLMAMLFRFVAVLLAWPLTEKDVEAREKISELRAPIIECSGPA